MSAVVFGQNKLYIPITVFQTMQSKMFTAQFSTIKLDFFNQIASYAGAKKQISDKMIFQGCLETFG